MQLCIRKFKTSLFDQNLLALNLVTQSGTFSFCQVTSMYDNWEIDNFLSYLNTSYIYRQQRSCGQGNIFTPVCHSVPWEQTPPGADTSPGSRHPPGSRYPPGSRHPPAADTLLPPPPHPQQTPLSLEADSSIRSTSSRYASYWNAFLFKSPFMSFFWLIHPLNRWRLTDACVMWLLSIFFSIFCLIRRLSNNIPSIKGHFLPLLTRMYLCSLFYRRFTSGVELQMIAQKLWVILEVWCWDSLHVTEKENPVMFISCNFYPEWEWFLSGHNFKSKAAFRHNFMRTVT